MHQRSCKDKRDPSPTKIPTRKPIVKKTPMIRPGTYTKNNNSHKKINKNAEVSKEDLINMVQKDITFNNPLKRKDLMEYIQKLCLNN